MAVSPHALAYVHAYERALEQASAGLGRLTPAESERFGALNATYRDRLAKPFIICVRRTDKQGILAAMQQRLAHTHEQEIAAAIAEIGAIVRIRLEDRA